MFVNFLRKLPASKGVRTIGSISTTEMPEIQLMCPEVASHEELHKFSIEQPDKFWSTLARSRLTWEEDFHTGMDCDFSQGKFNMAIMWEKDEHG